MEIKTAKVRYGMVKAKIGSRHNMRCPDGERRVFVVRDKSRIPDVDAKAFCVFCNKFWDSEDTLIAEHPENRIMHKQEETHLYMWWSTVPLPDKDKATVVSSDPKSKSESKIDYGKIYGFISNEDMDLYK